MTILWTIEAKRNSTVCIRFLRLIIFYYIYMQYKLVCVLKKISEYTLTPVLPRVWLLLRTNCNDPILVYTYILTTAITPRALKRTSSQYFTGEENWPGGFVCLTNGYSGMGDTGVSCFWDVGLIALVFNLLFFNLTLIEQGSWRCSIYVVRFYTLSSLRQIYPRLCLPLSYKRIERVISNFLVL